MNSRLGILKKNDGYQINNRFDFLAIKDGLCTNSRLGFADKNDRDKTYVRNDNVEIKDRF